MAGPVYVKYTFTPQGDGSAAEGAHMKIIKKLADILVKIINKNTCLNK